MKKGFIRLLSVTLCILMCTSLCAPLTFAEGLQSNRSLYLQNTYSKIMAGETVNIAYFGGSVTNGYAGNDANGVSQNCQSATDGRDCWREATFKWFESTFAGTGATFVENHCAIGGTGTDLNLYRTKNALKLGTEDAADLVFIEFAINDVFEGLTQDKSAENMEAIVRQIYASDPYTDIVFVIVTGSDQKSTKYANALGHEKIAKAYNIPCIWVGARLYNYISGLDGGVDENFYSYFADGCHPNVYGHAKYTEYIKNDLLIPCLTGDNIPATKKVKKIMPAPLYDGGYWNSYERIAGAESTGFSGYGFTSDGSKLNATVGGGDSFNVKFYGTGFGLRYTASDTNGLLQYSIDGGEYQAKNFRNPGSNGGTNISMLAQGLDAGWHEINVILRKTASGQISQSTASLSMATPDSRHLLSEHRPQLHQTLKYMLLT